VHTSVDVGHDRYFGRVELDGIEHLAQTPAGAASKIRVSFIGPPFAPFFPVADNADPGYTLAGRLIY